MVLPPRKSHPCTITSFPQSHLQTQLLLPLDLPINLAGLNTTSLPYLFPTSFLHLHKGHCVVPSERKASAETDISLPHSHLHFQ